MYFHLLTLVFTHVVVVLALSAQDFLDFTQPGAHTDQLSAALRTVAYRRQGQAEAKFIFDEFQSDADSIASFQM